MFIQEPGNIQNLEGLGDAGIWHTGARSFGAAIYIPAGSVLRGGEVVDRDGGRDWASLVISMRHSGASCLGGVFILISAHAPTEMYGLESYEALWGDVSDFIGRARAAHKDARILLGTDANVDCG